MFDNLKTLIWGKNLSKKTAKNRLQMVLVQDRSGMTSKDMDFFKKDLLEVISKYFVVETKNLQIEWKRTDSTTALVINTPITGRPRERKLATAS
ncbi:MAG: cell division topological specificity factor MinE [Bdellovibrionota bacterium]